MNQLNRRALFTRSAQLSAGSLAFSVFGMAKSKGIITKSIPKSSERLPVIGMGTWITFNVGHNKKLMDKRAEILRHFFAQGGALVDSSPMYGSSQKTVGYCIKKLSKKKAVFSADKIWTDNTEEGLEQFKEMQELWGIPSFDLVQIHNLRNWKEHLKNLLKLKSEKKVRYVGITTSHGRRHSDLQAIMKNEPIDFVQATYNLENREVEDKILHLTKDRKIAFIANRPLDGGGLFGKVRGKKLPQFSKDFGCENWAQFFLKFVVSHPSVTCAIPATSQLAHMKENMGACFGKLPDETQRQQMIKHFASL